jgi:tetratricopeptide (TPR) repeat protein
VSEFNWVYALLALVPFLFFKRMQKRERAWLIGITAIYLCLGVLLLILLNPPPDRQARELIRVFFTASHVCVAMAVGYGLTLVASTIATHYETARRAALFGGLVALDLAVFALAVDTHSLLGAGRADSLALYNFLKFVFVMLTSACVVLIGHRLFFRPSDEGHDNHALVGLGVIGVISLITAIQAFMNPLSGIEQSTLIGFAKIFCWLVAVVALQFALRPRQAEDRMTMLIIAGLLGVISLALTFVTLLGETPQLSGLGVFFSALGKVFQADQFALPVIATLILVGSAIVYVVATAVSKQRAPIWLALGLFAIMPLHSFLTHWAENEQRGHLFGYWFGHDMFTPPFDGPDGKFGWYDPKARAEMMKDPAKAKYIYPEMTRDAVLYGGTDPGRFCPTYTIFCESFIPPECKPRDPLYDRRDVYIITQNALADGTYLNYIRSHYNRSAQQDMPFFQELLRPAKERDPQNNYTTNLLARIALNVLDKPLTKWGAEVEARRRREGVYPPKEIYIASPYDSQNCFQEYLADAQRRVQHDQQFPNEPRQVKPGEDVRIDGGRVQVSGQVAVMAINGLLTKVMFDKNPTNEFFVEESFPLDWMYPHLTPFGIIMKINRQPLRSLPEEVMERDHHFWSRFSERLIGNWITYDTSVKDIAAFVEKVYLKHNYSGFKGDRKFVRDDQAQKAFSKLRSSIGGVYAWRLAQAPPEYRPKDKAEYDRIYKEADFTFRQAFAFCPYSPEAVFRYVNLLLQYNRVEDATIVAETCLKLDPYNGQVIDLVQRLRTFRDQASEMDKMRANLQKMEDEVRKNPTNFQLAFNLASTYAQLKQDDRASQILDRVLATPGVNAQVVMVVAEAYKQMNNWGKLEMTLEKLVQLMPEHAEPAYDLAGIKAALGKQPEALKYLKTALELNGQIRKTNASAPDLLAMLKDDARFSLLRTQPEFQKLTAPK